MNRESQPLDAPASVDYPHLVDVVGSSLCICICKTGYQTSGTCKKLNKAPRDLASLHLVFFGQTAYRLSLLATRFRQRFGLFCKVCIVVFVQDYYNIHKLFSITGKFIAGK